MGRGGYNIPISLSFASTTTSSASQNAPTVFNFNSPNATGGESNSTSEPIAPATATSSAAEGNAASGTSGSGVGATGASSSSLTSYLPYILIGGAVLAFIVLRKKGVA